MTPLAADDPAAPVGVQPSEEAVSSLRDLPDGLGNPGSDPKPVAVLICHGMGQQVPFETLASVADILHEPAAAGGAVPVVRHVHFVNPADPKRSIWLPRAEITVRGPAGQALRQVHVYEAYWAPLTEGRISLSEVMWFLVTAGLRGLRPQMVHFKRWVFGQFQTYDRPISTPLGLLATLLVIAALVAINALLTLVVGSNALALQQTAGAAGPDHRLLFQLTVDLGWLLAAGVVTAVPVLWSDRRRVQAHAARPPRPARPGLVDRLAGVALVALGVLVVLVAVAMAYHYLKLREAREADISGIWTLYPFYSRFDPRYPALATHALPWWLLLLVWGTVLGASFWAREFFVQYLGDVAIYIDSHKVDKFNKIRDQIKHMAFETACTIYGARAAGPARGGPLPFAYDQVVLAGHSLGSVITYDALNATLNVDDTLNGRLRVAERTGSLLTFGSPLDKTAFLFNSQQPKAALRVGLGASVQPMIRSLLVRSQVHWVNLYSPSDIISGALGFYELPPSVRAAAPAAVPDPQDVRVTNLVDPEAVTPLQAHTQYWSNALLAQELRRAIFRADALRS